MNSSLDIITAIEQQLACYQRLAKLADVQREHVQMGDAESLLAVLQRRAGVLEELSALERVVGPVKRDWATFTRSLSDDSRQHVEQVMLGSRELLEQITKSDQDDVLLLQQRKLNVGKQIGQATASRQVNRAYAGAAYSARGAGNMDLSR
ncbi:MAG TPA: hypothetical protein PLD59_03610 [Tepidisphaeraceae bacterium]|nr:hypothetical protein [Tepidisphaeraceae bacterium]